MIKKEKTETSISSKSTELKDNQKNETDFKKAFFSDTDTKIAEVGGQIVYKCFHGANLPHHQKAIRREISKITLKRAYSFLEGYETGREETDTNTNHFFKQMISETSFNDRENLIRTVAKNLQTKCESSKIKDFEQYGKIINEILKHSILTENDANKLDKIVYDIRLNNENSNAKNHPFKE